MHASIRSSLISALASLSLSLSLLFLLLWFVVVAMGSDQLSGLPSDLAYTDLVTFINNTAFQGFRYTKLIMSAPTARLACSRAEEANQMQALIHGKSIRSGFTISASIAASGGANTHAGRPLHNSERDQLRSHVRNAYDVNSKTLNLANIVQVPTLSAFASFQSPSFNAELLNAIQSAASECKSLNLANNQIQNLASLTRMQHVMPQLINLSLAGNYIARYKQHEAGSRTIELYLSRALSLSLDFSLHVPPRC